MPIDREPIVAGESAQQVLDVLRTFSLSQAPTGEVVVHNTAVGEARAMFARAYERMAAVVDAEDASCPGAAVHRTLHPEAYRFLVLAAIADAAKDALGQSSRIDAVWMAHPTGHDPMHRA